MHSHFDQFKMASELRPTRRRGRTPPSAGTGSVAWPDPRPSAIAPTSGAGTASTTKEEANQKQDVAKDQLSDTVRKNVVGGNSQVAKPTKTGIQHDEIPVAVLLDLGSVLVFAGIYLRDVVRAILAKRRTVHPVARRPSLKPNSAEEHAMQTGVTHHRDPTAGRVDEDGSDVNVKEAFDKLLRALDRQAA